MRACLIGLIGLRSLGLGGLGFRGLGLGSNPPQMPTMSHDNELVDEKSEHIGHYCGYLGVRRSPWPKPLPCRLKA